MSKYIGMYVSGRWGSTVTNLIKITVDMVKSLCKGWLEIN